VLEAASGFEPEYGALQALGACAWVGPRVLKSSNAKGNVPDAKCHQEIESARVAQNPVPVSCAV